MRYGILTLFSLAVISTTLAGEADTALTEYDIQVTSINDKMHVFSCFYGRHYVNVTVFAGPDGTLLVDSGHKRTAALLAKKIRELKLPESKYIINTHHHGDHTGGNYLLGREATIIAHENARKRISDAFREAESDSTIHLPDIVVVDSMRLEFNDEDVRIYYLPRGHTDNDMIVHFVKANVVCMGDLLFSDALPHVFTRNGGSVDGFIANIGSVLEWLPENAVIVPGHGSLYTKAELGEYRKMLIEITRRVRKQIETGAAIDEILASDILGDWRNRVSREFVSDSAWSLIVYSERR